MGGGIYANGDGHGVDEQQGKYVDHERHRQPGHDEGPDRHVVGEGPAPVALEKSKYPLEILPVNRKIETVGLPERSQKLLVHHLALAFQHE